MCGCVDLLMFYVETQQKRHHTNAVDFKNRLAQPLSLRMERLVSEINKPHIVDVCVVYSSCVCVL